MSEQEMESLIQGRNGERSCTATKSMTCCVRNVLPSSRQTRGQVYTTAEEHADSPGDLGFEYMNMYPASAGPPLETEIEM